jgi:hypothetical protein
MLKEVVESDTEQGIANIGPLDCGNVSRILLFSNMFM